MVLQKPSWKESLSPLEAEILQALWNSGPSLVRDLFPVVKKHMDCAKTSISVTLDRLYDDGLVSRKTVTGRGGLAYIYAAKVSRDEFEKSLVQKAVDRLVSRFGNVAVSYFNEKYNKN
jgi:predicted transcriptional regulator